MIFMKERSEENSLKYYLSLICRSSRKITQIIPMWERGNLILYNLREKAGMHGFESIGGVNKVPLEKLLLFSHSVISDSCSYIPKSGHARSYGNSILIFLRNHHTVFHDSCTLYISISGLLSLVQSLSHVQLFATPWTAARQASLSITDTRSLLKLMSVESVMPSNHLNLCLPFLLLPSIFPSIRVFSNESALRVRWLKYWRS